MAFKRPKPPDTAAPFVDRTGRITTEWYRFIQQLFTDSTTAAVAVESGAAGATTLDELTDVTITDVENGQTITYDELTDQWINSTLDLGSGGVDGSGAATQIAYWSDSDTLTGSNRWTISGNYFNLNENGLTNGFFYTENMGDWTYNNGESGSDALIYINVANGSNALLEFTTGASYSNRWSVGKEPTAESGSDVGSDFVIQRYNDSGTPQDTPFKITRSNGKVDIENDLVVGGSITAGSSTVAGLPTPATGMIRYVTDANAPSIGSTVAGGGAAFALVTYNGSNWTVIGV